MTTRLTLFALLMPIACGGGGSANDPAELGPDASVTDPDDPDTDPELPTSGPCSVSTGIHGITAVLHDASGAILETGTTDGSGSMAFADCPQSSMISFASFSDDLDGWRGVTVASVQPGQDIDVRLPLTGWQGTLMTQVPVDGSDIEYERLYMGGSCDVSTSEGASQELPITADCLGDDRSKIAVLATGRIDDVWVYAHSETDKSFVPNAVTNVVLDDMTGWMSGGSIAVSAINSPSNLVLFKMEYLRNGLGYGKASWAQTLDEEDVATLAIPVPPNAFSTERLVGVASSGSARKGYMMFSSDPAVELDLDNGLAEMTDMDLDTSDPLRPVFSATGIPADSDLAMFRSHWFNDDDDEVQWYVIVPTETMSSVQLPELPEAFGKAMPTDSVELDEIYAIDMTGENYEDILTGGYVLRKHHMNCGTVTDGNMCRFSMIQQ